MARVPITDDIHAELLRLKEQSGMGMMKLLARSGPVPEGLDSAIINTWLNRKTLTARADHLDFVLNALRAVDPIIQITPDMRAALDAELARTGYEPTSLLNRIGPHPVKVTPALISRWRKGQTLSARKSLWDFVIEGLASISDKSA
ncbi:hypothetical protein AWH62_12770 [Maricaulis sp. W15]|uniref:hypothetical protein n=1 Tax=Maricaulis sp. W15 TaxID=1772333 RepID=UPI000948DF7D|nr:hypothetical protein [Maricaulis sp. W15]OLF71413.1 hypothetical protein AWH62_12770 [Maricaulis sp. W15]